MKVQSTNTALPCSAKHSIQRREIISLRILENKQVFCTIGDYLAKQIKFLTTA